MNPVTDDCEQLQEKIDKAIAMLKKNIETVPPHGCQRDAVLAVLEMEGSHGKT